jgi:hypothetical protein
MSRLCRFFVIIIVAYTAAGCTPVGSIGGSGAADFLLAVPVPKGREYKVGDTFTPNGSLEVWVPYQTQSGLREIPISQVTVKISEPPHTSNKITEIPYGGSYTLRIADRYVIIVEYLGMSASCYIDVLASTERGTASFIEIVWEKDDE